MSHGYGRKKAYIFSKRRKSTLWKLPVEQVSPLKDSSFFLCFTLIFPPYLGIFYKNNRRLSCNQRFYSTENQCSVNYKFVLYSQVSIIRIIICFPLKSTKALNLGQIWVYIDHLYFLSCLLALKRMHSRHWSWFTKGIVNVHTVTLILWSCADEINKQGFSFHMIG